MPNAVPSVCSFTVGVAVRRPAPERKPRLPSCHPSRLRASQSHAQEERLRNPLHPRYIPNRRAAQASRPRLAMRVRGHWAVENNIFWVRDKVWNEDACCTHSPVTPAPSHCRAPFCSHACAAPATAAPPGRRNLRPHKSHLALHIVLRQRLALRGKF